MQSRDIFVNILFKITMFHHLGIFSRRARATMSITLLTSLSVPSSLNFSRFSPIPRGTQCASSRLTREAPHPEIKVQDSHGRIVVRDKKGDWILTGEKITATAQRRRYLNGVPTSTNAPHPGIHDPIGHDPHPHVGDHQDDAITQVLHYTLNIATPPTV